MAQDLFRVEVGLADDNVHYLSGAGAPTGTYADAAPAGSKWSNTVNGDTYTRTATAWVLLATGGDATALQQELDDTQAALGLNTDGSLSWGVTPGNFLGTDTVKAAIVKLDTAVTDVETLAAGTAGDLATFISAQTTRDNNQDTAISNKVSKSGDTMSGNLAFGGTHTVTGLAAPVNGDDAATKNYVDSAVTGLTWKEPVDTIGATLPLTAIVGERFLNTTDDKIYTATGVDTWNAGVVPSDNWAVFEKATDSGWTFNGTDWVQFSGAGQIDAGVGLKKTGNVIDINLGAGISQLPSDEVGIDVRANSGLFLTEDGSTASSGTDAQLAVKLDGTTLAVGANGLKVADSVITSISNVATDLATEITNRTNADTGLQNSIDRIEGVLGNARSETISRGVTTQVVQDYIPVSSAAVVKWIVHVTGTGVNANKKQTIEVLAMHNGAPDNATDVDYTTYAKLKLGVVTGLNINVTVDAAGPTQRMNLNVSSTMNVDVAAVREIVFVGDTVYTTHGEMVIA